MSNMERMEVLQAIWDTDLEFEAAFTIHSFHEPPGQKGNVRGSWSVVLSPHRSKLYFLTHILGIIESLELDIDAHLDVNRPGCLVLT